MMIEMKSTKLEVGKRARGRGAAGRMAEAARVAAPVPQAGWSRAPGRLFVFTLL